MSLAFLTLISLLVVFVGWMMAEFRGRIWIRLAVGFAGFAVVATTAFMWGQFTEALTRTEFLEPHDSPAQTVQMDAAEKSATNSLSR